MGRLKLIIMSQVTIPTNQPPTHYPPTTQGVYAQCIRCLGVICYANMFISYIDRTHQPPKQASTKERLDVSIWPEDPLQVLLVQYYIIMIQSHLRSFVCRSTKEP